MCTPLFPQKLCRCLYSLDAKQGYVSMNMFRIYGLKNDISYAFSLQIFVFFQLIQFLVPEIKQINFFVGEVLTLYNSCHVTFSSFHVNIFV